MFPEVHDIYGGKTSSRWNDFPSVTSLYSSYNIVTRKLNSQSTILLIVAGKRSKGQSSRKQKGVQFISSKDSSQADSSDEEEKAFASMRKRRKTGRLQ